MGVWQAGGLPSGTYTLRLRVVKVDGNYAEYYIPNISVNGTGASAAAPSPTATLPLTPTVTPTFTPAPQPTAVIGQVTQPQVEGDVPPTATPTPAVVAGDPAADPAAAAPADAAAGADSAVGTLAGTTDGGVQNVPAASVTDQLGESLGFERLRTQFFNGVRISAALFIGLAALLAGKKLFEWVWKKYG
jgi:hypothetical protein